eukprot:3402727-Heterocapsa_arctica.AAC.1
MKLVIRHVCSVLFVPNWFVVMNPAVRPDAPVKSSSARLFQSSSLRSRWLRRRLARLYRWPPCPELEVS